MSTRFSWSGRLASFRHAFNGLRTLLVEEHNARLHLAATLAVVILATLLDLPPLEWALLLLAIALVWLAEALNSALEALADAVHPEQHPMIGKAKDLGAGAVLVTACCAALIGLLVFVPYLF